MSTDQPEVSPLDAFLHLAVADPEFRVWLERWRTIVTDPENVPSQCQPDRKIMKYPDMMSQTIQQDLKRLNVTDSAIAAAAKNSDLDQVAVLLEQRGANAEEQFLIDRIETWRTSLVKPPSDEL
ncbi:MAG: hypothetical protein JWM07_436 [Candidatus Saccharibacteria bacterium]|nr:hypothetical protein [Candidatus Saccharibacteria bacterium]